MKLAYYPGCLLHSTGKEYEQSTQAVCNQLGVELVEIGDWNCCGASAAHSIHHRLAIELSARNLLLVQRMNVNTVVVPCSACYNNLKKADIELKDNEEMKHDMEKLTGIRFKDNLEIIHLVNVLHDKIGIDNVKQKIKMPVEGLNVVPYYGCLITRPDGINAFDNTEQPQAMDNILKVTGCNVLQWSYKTDCCGAGLSLSQSDIVTKLVTKLVDMAVQAGAECIVTACPMCQANLEMRQNGTNMPVLYFTEIIGIAMGIKKAYAWLRKHIINIGSIPKKLPVMK
jgi:heterodisulfide reductase subunit B